MKLSTSHTINAPRERVFAAITNPEVLQKCIDGCEKMVLAGEDAYDAHLKIGFAGMKGTYIGKILLKNIHAPESYTLSIEGKGAPGFVKGTAQIHLDDRGQQTELKSEVDAQVGGLIAMIGSRLIQAAAKKMADDFFTNFAKQLETAGG